MFALLRMFNNFQPCSENNSAVALFVTARLFVKDVAVLMQSLQKDSRQMNVVIRDRYIIDRPYVET